ncbi:MAG TPA: sulfite exporter TauE/SafE family protein [Burkholderiaceae bacterium]|nr:sulfite exporter TauE/SafE family protein [Burkholderiaceae bacterium]
MKAPALLPLLAAMLTAAAAATVAATLAAPAEWRAAVSGFIALFHVDVAPKWIVLSLIVFLAAGVSSTVGFAFSALAGAMILHVVADRFEAVQIMMIASIGIQALSVAKLARSISWTRCAPFMAGGIAATPLGALLLLSFKPQAYVPAMGAALAAYGLYRLVRRAAAVKRNHGRAADVLIGALGGITGPLAALPGPWLTIWCGMRGWDKVEQRAVYQPYILLMQLVGFGAVCLVQPPGGLDPRLFAYALPACAGAMIGLRVFHALTDMQFQRLINGALVASGAALLFK